MGSSAFGPRRPISVRNGSKLGGDKNFSLLGNPEIDRGDFGRGIDGVHLTFGEFQNLPPPFKHDSSGGDVNGERDKDHDPNGTVEGRNAQHIPVKRYPAP